ncbi:MAG: hypothetical protein OK455_04390 [Thaumarchaeota archaeon]|jgi:hypothetical protein|nr:hypothetical protein [Nitrososphaerota archaeon]
MNSKIFIWIAAALALVGLIVNVAVDLDNVYDMTMATLWVLTLVFAFLGAYMGRKS